MMFRKALFLITVIAALTLGGCASQPQMYGFDDAGAFHANGQIYKYLYRNPKTLGEGYYVEVAEASSDVMRLRWVIKTISRTPIPRTRDSEVLYVSDDLRVIQPAWRFVKPMVGMAESQQGPYRIFICDADGWQRHADRYSPCNSVLMTQTEFAWSGVNYRVSDADYEKGYLNGQNSNFTGPRASFYRIDDRKMDRILAETDLVARLKGFSISQR